MLTDAERQVIRAMHAAGKVPKWNAKDAPGYVYTVHLLDTCDGLEALLIRARAYCAALESVPPSSADLVALLAAIDAAIGKGEG